VNWFKIIKETDTKNVTLEDIKTKINLFKKSTSGTARKYIDNTMNVLELVKEGLTK